MNDKIKAIISELFRDVGYNVPDDIREKVRSAEIVVVKEDGSEEVIRPAKDN